MFDVVTMMAEDVVVLPLVSRATAVNECVPLLAELEFLAPAPVFYKFHTCDEPDPPNIANLANGPKLLQFGIKGRFKRVSSFDGRAV